ncbi:MAG: sigma-70 family RNA polymerase sigma factor [Clostridia bacterium]|nr:sigma-70 family RNA polymerase sigma factor [Clostridia bacterium]
MEKTTDLTLLVKRAQKDPDAFAQLYAQTISFSCAVARRYLSNPQDVEDVLQMSYMYVSKSFSDLREPENFLNWMRMIVIHECQKCLKTSKKFSDLTRRQKEAAVDKDEIAEWTDFLEQYERYEAVCQIMDSLPNEQKMCAALFYYDGKSVEEIAELLDVPQGTVKSRLYHARKKFEKSLKKLSDQDAAFAGVPPIPVLWSYFKCSESKTASIALRKSVWSSLFAQGVTSSSAGSLASAGLAGTAVSAGTTVPTAIKAAAIALTAVTAVGGGVTAVKRIQADTLPSAEPVMTATKAYETANRFSSSETSDGVPEQATVTRQSTTDSAAVQAPTGTTVREPAPSDGTTAAAQETVRQTESAIQTTAKSQVKSTTGASVAPTTTPSTQLTTAVPTRAPTTQPTTAAAQYQMTGGVLRSYTGSESSVSIPATVNGETVTAIGSSAFAQNETVRSVQIPNGVTQIGQQAFSDCTSLQSVSLPSSLSSIGAGAFDGCTSLSSVTVPNGTTTIGDDAFSNCSSLRQITIPSSVTSLGDDAFSGCDELTIRCAEGSAAHTYAKNNGISYQLVEGI